MKVFLRDQQRRLADFLTHFRQLPLSYTHTTGFREKYTRIALPLDKPAPALDACRFDFLFNYVVFPANILTFAADWESEARLMQPGDNIIQQAYLPPWCLGLKCVFGVRVLDTVRTPDKVGFRYGTLVGHAEQGISAFYIERSGGQVWAVIHTLSVPGLLLSRLAAPFFTYRYQQYCTDRAVRQMGASFLAENP